MQYLFTIIKADYLQRTRSYSFLIILAFTVLMAYAFTPDHNANYTTLSAAGYKGAYNSAWVGYVTSIMTAVMLSYAGFLLINSGIKKDIETEVGLIIATTPISNFKYLLCKLLSNYLLLLTITLITFLMSIAMFFFRGAGYPFVWSNFILPYLFFPIPALFVVASLAVVGEVFLRKRTILQFILYFVLCGVGMSLINSKSDPQTHGFLDPFGLNLITKSVVHHLNTHFNENLESVSFGFIFNGQKRFKVFEWEGLSWSTLFVLSRLLWIGIGLVLVYISSLFFHRFDLSEPAKPKKRKGIDLKATEFSAARKSMELSITRLPALTFNYGIFSIVKTELRLLFRQGNQWIWLLNAGLWLAMCFTPLEIAYSYLLPILLFMQVTRWSELATKEKTNRVHYFAYASYKPLQRLLPAQMLSGLIFALLLSLPIILRSTLNGDGFTVIHIINGNAFIVLLAVALGILSGGKKLFEIIFFLLTYAVLNKVPATAYLGGLPHQNPTGLMLVVLAANVILLATSLAIRNYQTRNL